MIWEGQLFQQPFAYDDLDAEFVKALQGLGMLDVSVKL